MVGQLIDFPKQQENPEKAKLTPKLVASAEYDRGIDSSWQVIWDTEVAGFGLRLRWNKRTERTTRTYILIYRQRGKRRQLTIGDPAKITPQQARDAARKAWARVELGEDPSVEKQERRRAAPEPEHATCAELFATWIDEYAKLKRKTWRIDAGRLLADPDDVESEDAKERRRNAPIRKMHPLRPGESTREEVEDALLELHQALTDAGTPGEANKVVATIRTAFNWHVKRRNITAAFIDISEIVDVNPSQPRDAHIRPSELPKFAKACATLKRPWRAAIWFMLLTGARSKSEALSLRWADVHLDVGELVFPDTKNGKDHRLPITPALRILLEQRPRTGEYVFQGRKGPMLESRKQFAKLRQRAGFVDHITPHALRHTARTLLQTKLRLPGPTVDAVTNHSTQGMAGTYTHVTIDDVRDALLDLERLILSEAKIEDFAAYLAKAKQ